MMFVGCPGRVLDIRNLVTAQSETDSIIVGLGLRTGSSTSSYLWVQKPLGFPLQFGFSDSIIMPSLLTGI
jgi:hypothetical protein